MGDTSQQSHIDCVTGRCTDKENDRKRPGWTPGMIFLSGKWPVKKLSFAVMFLYPMAYF